MTLYLKYRPQTIDELDLESVRKSLTDIVKSKNIPHAFLFSGPRGSGKTSAARILAKVLNCPRNQDPSGHLRGKEPCNKCSVCKSITTGSNIDIIEMDAASNRGIDDIRALREQVGLAPSSAAEKVYIIDEAHMLTTEAANALLKTLEEPPSHVIFILATTDPLKLPITIQSRLSNIKFTKATDKEIHRQLTRVIKGEKLKIEKSAIDLIAKHSDGSFREAVKILESLAHTNKKITVETASDFLDHSKGFDAEDFVKNLIAGSVKESIEEVKSAIKKGASAKSLVDEIIIRLRSRILSDYNDDKAIKLLDLLFEAKNKMQYSSIEELPLEIAIIKFKSEVSNGFEEKPEPAIETEAKDQIEKKSAPPAKQKINKELKNVDDDVWTKILVALRAKNTTIEALLRAAEPINYDKGNLNLGVYYQFHKERLEVNQNTKLLEDACAEVMGLPVKVSFMLVERAKALPAKEDPNTPNLANPLTSGPEADIIQAAKEIFGN